MRDHRRSLTALLLILLLLCGSFAGCAWRLRCGGLSVAPGQVGHPLLLGLARQVT